MRVRHRFFLQIPFDTVGTFLFSALTLTVYSKIPRGCAGKGATRGTRVIRPDLAAGPSSCIVFVCVGWAGVLCCWCGACEAPCHGPYGT